MCSCSRFIHEMVVAFVYFLFCKEKKACHFYNMENSVIHHQLSDGLEFDTPYNILDSEEWEHQITAVELQTIINQVSVSQNPLNHPNTAIFWHKPEDTSIVMEAFRETKYQEMTHFFWHKKGHTSAAQARDYVRSVEMATIGFYPNRRSCYINHHSDPRSRHNFLELPHISHFVKDAANKKVNPAEKPPELAAHFCEHHIPPGGTILIVGAGAGGSVFGALKSGVNVVAVESDEFQFKFFSSTFLAKSQAELDRLKAAEESEDEVEATQQNDEEKSDGAATDKNANPQRDQQAKGCDSCNAALSPDDVDVGATCHQCEGIQGIMCSGCRVQDRADGTKWLCQYHSSRNNDGSQGF